jgi:hypothetical protein
MTEREYDTPIDDPVDVLKGIDLLMRARDGKPAQMACCPRDGEPLIMTMERRGAEFHCMVCGAWLGFLAPTGKDGTPELDARYTELRERFRAGERGPL